MVTVTISRILNGKYAWNTRLLGTPLRANRWGLVDDIWRGKSPDLAVSYANDMVLMAATTVFCIK